VKHRSGALIEFLVLRLLSIFSPVQVKVLLFSALLPAMLFIGVQSAEATNHYILAGASGTGASWADPLGNLPTSLVRGDIYYMADGSYGNHTFNDTQSGTIVITVKKATVADHGTSTGWNDIMGDGQAFLGQLVFTRGYYIIDGQTRSADWDSGYGFVIDRSATDDHAIDMQSGTRTNITLRYIDMEGKFAGANHLDLIYLIGTDHITMEYLKVRNPSRCPILSRDSSFLLLQYSLLGDNTYTPSFHSEGWSDGGSNNVTVRYNKWRNAIGTGVIVELAGPTSADSWIIYGNIFYITRTGGMSMGGGSIQTLVDITSTNWKIYNNTIYGATGVGSGFYLAFGGGNDTNSEMYNNLWYSNVPADNNTTRMDYNYYNATTHSPVEAHEQVASGNPFVNSGASDFHLVSPTNPGLSLTNATVNGILQTYDRDMNGVLRGADGVWDRGALEFGSGVDNTPPQAPTNLRIQ